MRDIAFKVLRHNAFFAHPELVIIAMPGDENKPVRDIAVDKIISLCETLTAGHIDNQGCELERTRSLYRLPTTGLELRVVTCQFGTIHSTLDRFSHQTTNLLIVF